MDERSPPAAQVARDIGTTPATLRRWLARGLIPQYDGQWTPAAIAHARLVARMRERGHSLERIRVAGESGRLAFGNLQGLFPSAEPTHTLGLLVRVYGQALAQMADAEVRLFHMYVHEPLMRDGVPGVQMAEEMQDLAADLLPLTSPMMDLVHRRLLAHFVDQDVIAHMEAELDPRERLALGHLRVAIAFADLAGYTRLTEELGDEHAVDIVERFVSDVEHTLPDDARIVKTIGDEVMIVASDVAALVDWAVGFQALHATRPLPRIGMHCGEVLYRDGDYHGREVNQAARVSARAGAGEVLVTRDVVEGAGAHLDFELIGEVRLKGFSGATELFLARARDD